MFVLSIRSNRVDRRFVSRLSTALHCAMNRWVGIGVLFITGEADILFVVLYVFHDYPARLKFETGAHVHHIEFCWITTVRKKSEGTLALYIFPCTATSICRLFVVDGSNRLRLFSRCHKAISSGAFWLCYFFNHC